MEGSKAIREKATKDEEKTNRKMNWEEWYRDEEVESMPWFLPELDHDFDATLRELNLSGGRVLDLGTGPGTQAIELACRGFAVTGTDISGTAVAKATQRASREGCPVEFLQDDILQTRLNGRRFDMVMDRGCFHVLPPEMRSVYVETVDRLLEDSGHLLLKCFSYLEPGEEGPHRLRPEEIRECFGTHFHVRSIRESFFRGNRKPEPKALFCLLKKKAG